MRRALVSVVVILLGLVIYLFEGDGATHESPTPPHAEKADRRTESGPGDESIEALFAAQVSDRWVEVGGHVDRLLADDRDGSQHQKFVLRLQSGHTVLVAHNIDLAPRVPLKKGDRITLRGEYEWNARGGVVHWTHHDPRGRRAGGWIDTADRRYE